MTNIGYPYSYGYKRKVNYEIELVNKTVNFLKGIIQKTYRITKVISKCGVVQKVIISFVTFVFALRLRFGSSSPIEPIIQPQTQIERQLQHSTSTQLYQAMEGFKSSSVRNLFKIYGGDLDLGKGSNTGARARSDARKAITNRTKGPKAAKSKPGGSSFAEAWVQNPSNRARPEGANRLAQQFQSGQAQGGNELFGQFSTRLTPDPSNPGCAGGLRSITVRSSQHNPNSSTEITAHDGVKGKLTDKSSNHLTSKHAHYLSIDDLLPPSPNQKLVKFPKIRTRINKENKKQVTDTLEKILQDPNTEVFPDVSIRGIKGHDYYTKDYGQFGFFVGITTEGELAGQITKAQPVSDKQLKTLEKLNKID